MDGVGGVVFDHDLAEPGDDAEPLHVVAVAEELGGPLHVAEILRERILFHFLDRLWVTGAARRGRGRVRSGRAAAATRRRPTHPLVLLAKLCLMLLAQLPVEEVHGGRRG